MSAPCIVWATEADLPATCKDDTVHPPTIVQAMSYASTILYNLTKRRWSGLCSDSWRPYDMGRCWNPACSTSTGLSNYSRGGITWAYDHDAIKLPARNVRAVQSIVINGTTIDPATYEIRDSRYLWRKLDRVTGQGFTSWPCWQDMHRWDGEKDTFTIAYTYGLDPPADMKLACAILAWEFAVAWTPDCTRECRLPRNITSMSRSGVNFTFPDPTTLFEKGKTNVPDVDMLVMAVMRGDAVAQPIVGIPGKTSIGSRSTWHS